MSRFNLGSLSLIVYIIVMLSILWVLLFYVPMGNGQNCRGCGLEPLKPLAPMGCRDLRAVCRCTEDFKTHECECHWEWDCVPYGLEDE